MMTMYKISILAEALADIDDHVNAFAKYGVVPHYSLTNYSHAHNRIGETEKTIKYSPLNTLSYQIVR